jgi:hypothetical protein
VAASLWWKVLQRFSVQSVSRCTALGARRSAPQDREEQSRVVGWRPRSAHRGSPPTARDAEACAVLYQLTRLLAENGAVPVPIRLRDAEDGVDFATLARERFIAKATGASISSAGDLKRFWREMEDRARR